MKIITGLAAFCVLILGLLLLAAFLCRGDTCLAYGFLMLPIFATAAVGLFVGLAIWRSERHGGTPPISFRISVGLLGLLTVLGAALAKALL
jgi:hypothetical protein